jgi:hypothetical protein
MRWIVTGVAMAVVALAGVDVARACGCCKGGGSGCPSCPQNGSPPGSARPAACPSCPQTEAASGAYQYPNSGAGYSPRYDPATRVASNPPAGAGRDRPVATQPVTRSTFYLAATRPVQTTSRYERPAR